jgi:hypothetical protein
VNSFPKSNDVPKTNDVLLFILWRTDDVKNQSKRHVPHSTIGSIDLTLINRLREIVEISDIYECCSISQIRSNKDMQHILVCKYLVKQRL